MIVDEQRVSYAAAFLDGKDYAIHKVTRAGFTTSFVIAAERSCKRVLLVSPTKRIISDTMKGAAGDIVGIYGNSACEYNRRDIAKEPLLGQLPMSLPGKCDGCKYADDCCILDIERNPAAPMKSLTAAKLEAIMVSDSERAQRLREILRDIDVVLFDEAHTLVTSNVAKLPLDAHLHDLVPKIQQGFPLLVQAHQKWTRLRFLIEPEVNDLWTQVDYNPDSWLIRELNVPRTLTLDEQRKIWGELRKLAINHEYFGVNDEEVLQLRDLIEILSHDTARLSYITHDGTGQIYVCGAIDRTNSAIRDYLTNYAKKASVIFVSGTLYEPYPDFFRGIVGREFMGVDLPLEQSIFPDILNTNSKMTVYADTNRLSGNTRQKQARIPDIIDRIKEISESKQNAPIHVLAPNIELHNRLHKALAKEYPNLFFDYYRSANTMGVSSGRRIIIAVGLAEVPKNAYDCLANSYTESQTIRVGSVAAATWQAWSRAKDPEGKMPSEVHCIGVRAEAVERVLTWGPGRTLIKTGANSYRVECVEELPKPAILEPYKKQANVRLRKSSPFIKRVWDVAEDLEGCAIPVYELEIPSTKTVKITYNTIRENNGNRTSDSGLVRCFGAIYAQPQSSEEFRITAETLDIFFRSKKGWHAEQLKYPDSKGRFGYHPHKTRDWVLELMDMLDGTKTIAPYSIGEDGHTVQCAFDLDNHSGTNPALPRVTATKSHIEKLGAQAVVVASGSSDSYHVHIPILRTPIGTSHEFIKTVHHELKQSHKDLDFRHDTETFPKQSNAHHPYGSALKLPGAINNKTGKRAELLDDDLKPTDVIYITKVVELREPEKEAVKVGSRKYIAQMVRPARRQAMRPCIVDALNRPLEGGSGHDMRVAVVCEALAAGKSRNDIIGMFAGQLDFDEAITSKAVDYFTLRGYHPWKCETLQDRCGPFIDCESCPLRRAPEIVEEAR